jgi:hypothetical protein
VPWSFSSDSTYACRVIRRPVALNNLSAHMGPEIAPCHPQQDTTTRLHRTSPPPGRPRSTELTSSTHHYRSHSAARVPLGECHVPPRCHYSNGPSEFRIKLAEGILTRNYSL